MTEDEMKIDELLSNGTLSGAQHENILHRVLASSNLGAAPRGRSWPRWGFVAAGGFASMLGAWLLFALPAGKHTFTAKGHGGSADGAVVVACGASGGPTCRIGDTLMFSVNTAVVSGSLGAYAEPVDGSATGRIWYFPSADGSAPAVSPGAGTIVLPKGVRIGPEHAPGRYRVTTWLADRPLARGEIDAAGLGALRNVSTLEIEVSP